MEYYKSIFLTWPLAMLMEILPIGKDFPIGKSFKFRTLL